MSPSLTFPLDKLTQVEGRPTPTDVQTLRKELYANAMAIHSNLGGGENGHLGLVMPAAEYLVRAKCSYDAPDHPGTAPTHATGATGPQIKETNRKYLADLEAYALHRAVEAELKKQLLLAVEDFCVKALSDVSFGYANVTVLELMAHLHSEYGAITQDDIEANRATLSTAWNTDDPIEHLWIRISEARNYAAAAGEAISEATAVRLTLAVLETTGAFVSAIEMWRYRPETDYKVKLFTEHFNRANKERLRLITATHGTPRTTGSTGFHEANQATAQQAPTSVYYYCWTHGTTKNPRHTSKTCNDRREGHKEDATAENKQGGSKRPDQRRYK